MFCRGWVGADRHRWIAAACALAVLGGPGLLRLAGWGALDVEARQSVATVAPSGAYDVVADLLRRVQSGTLNAEQVDAENERTARSVLGPALGDPLAEFARRAAEYGYTVRSGSHDPTAAVDPRRVVVTVVDGRVTAIVAVG